MSHVAIWMGRGAGMWGHGMALRWFAFFLFAAFLVLVVVGAALLWRRGSGPGPVPQSGPDAALATIRMRYAKGEMTREEFLQANEDLGGPAPHVSN